MVFKDRFEADLFNKFLSRLVKQNTIKGFTIVDRHTVHQIEPHALLPIHQGLYGI